MDKLVRKIEVPLAKSAITDAGLYIASPEDIGRLAEVAMEAYQDYPLHNWLTNGHYDREASKRIMEVSLRTMANDGVIYADSPELNGFAAWLPLGFTGSKTVPFLTNGGLRLILRAGPGIIGRLLTYETFAMRLKEKYTANVDWYRGRRGLRPHPRLPVPLPRHPDAVSAGYILRSPDVRRDARHRLLRRGRVGLSHQVAVPERGDPDPDEL